MDVIASPGLLLGLLFGVPAGMAIQHARHLVRAHQNTKASLPGQKEAASTAETHGALWLLVVGVLALLVVVVIVASE
jgi:hypothetical protein